MSASGEKWPFVDRFIFFILHAPAKVTAPAIIAFLPAFSGLRDVLTVTDLNDFNGLTQTTNLGVRSSNLFGRATNLLVLIPNFLRATEIDFQVLAARNSSPIVFPGSIEPRHQHNGVLDLP